MSAAHHPHPAEHPAPPIVDRAGEHRDHARRQQHHEHLGRPHPLESVDHLVEQYPWQSGLGEIPVPEQHAVGQPPDECSADEGASDRHAGVPAGVECRGDEADRADERRKEIENRGELGPDRRLAVRIADRRIDGTFDAGHRCDTLAATVVLDPRSAHAGRLATQRDRQGEQARDHHADRCRLANGHDPERQPGSQGTGGETEVDAPQQPAIPEAGDAPPGGEPAEQHAAGRPLQEHGGGVEADHVGQR